MKRSNAFLATALFLGGFIPLKGTIPNEKNISYSIYGTISEAKIYIQCNEIKRQILEVYNTLPIYNFSQAKEQIKMHLEWFYFNGIEFVQFKDNNLALTFGKISTKQLIMKGILYEKESEKNILNKKYFIDEIFR